MLRWTQHGQRGDSVRTGLLGRPRHAGGGPAGAAFACGGRVPGLHRYALSAGDNIALGRHERAGYTAAIVQAAERAGADKDIVGLPEGYETLLGPAFIDGTDLSTGQWQRARQVRRAVAAGGQGARPTGILGHDR